MNKSYNAKEKTYIIKSYMTNYANSGAQKVEYFVNVA